jgi:hypothetical protein
VERGLVRNCEARSVRRRSVQPSQEGDGQGPALFCMASPRTSSSLRSALPYTAPSTPRWSLVLLPSALRVLWLAALLHLGDDELLGRVSFCSYSSLTGCASPQPPPASDTMGRKPQHLFAFSTPDPSRASWRCPPNARSASNIDMAPRLLVSSQPV